VGPGTGAFWTRLKNSTGICLSSQILWNGNNWVSGRLPADNISRVINEGIRRATEKSAPQSVSTQQVTEPQSDDPFKILKMCLAKGEISKAEFEETKQLLE
jgi:hypothetical protein